MYELALDFSLTLEERMDIFSKLSVDEKDTLIETLCSVYNVHPTHLCFQYLQTLLLSKDINTQRRIRISEICEFWLLCLFLLTNLPLRERISCIEMFSNPYLKLHAYYVLYEKVDFISEKIQILKNIYSIYSISKNYKKIIISWFVSQMENLNLDYKIRTNCADFVLISKEADKQQKRRANIVLNIEQPVMDIYEHKENVHLFVPKTKLIEKLLTETSENARLQDITEFITNEMKVDTGLFIDRIVNDKTILGGFRVRITLWELLSKLWFKLTSDLKKLMIEDLYSSKEEEWMCTSGYYHRIINIYQTLDLGENLFTADFLENKNEVVSFVRDEINKRMWSDENKDQILEQLTENSIEKRIAYMTFKVNTLPSLLEDIRKKFPNLKNDDFDEYVSFALNKYEETL
jgi:hypothetical protein